MVAERSINTLGKRVKNDILEFVKLDEKPNWQFQPVYIATGFDFLLRDKNVSSTSCFLAKDTVGSPAL